MKIAIINEKRKEAQPGLSGSCQFCGSKVIAHCGEVRIWHWKHQGKRKCDPWKENETEWHRAWKGNFPAEQQEVVRFAEDGERHIADVLTEHGIAVEFQHSYIKPEERRSREEFHKQMIWIVNGSRRQRDKTKFFDIMENATRIDTKGMMWKFTCDFDSGALIRDWGKSKVPVFFDFGDGILHGLLPNITGLRRYMIRIRQNDLVSILIREQENEFKLILNECFKLVVAHEDMIQRRARQAQQINMRVRRPPLRRSRRL